MINVRINKDGKIRYQITQRAYGKPSESKTFYDADIAIDYALSLPLQKTGRKPLLANVDFKKSEDLDLVYDYMGQTVCHNMGLYHLIAPHDFAKLHDYTDRAIAIASFLKGKYPNMPKDILSIISAHLANWACSDEGRFKSFEYADRKNKLQKSLEYKIRKALHEHEITQSIIKAKRDARPLWETFYKGVEDNNKPAVSESD